MPPLGQLARAGATDGQWRRGRTGVWREPAARWLATLHRSLQLTELANWLACILACWNGSRSSSSRSTWRAWMSSLRVWIQQKIVCFHVECCAEFNFSFFLRLLCRVQLGRVAMNKLFLWGEYFLPSPKYCAEKKSKFQEFTKSSPYRGPFFRAITAETRPILCAHQAPPSEPESNGSSTTVWFLSVSGEWGLVPPRRGNKLRAPELTI
jgi:hypothetical protein